MGFLKNLSKLTQLKTERAILVFDKKQPCEYKFFCMELMWLAKVWAVGSNHKRSDIILSIRWKFIFENFDVLWTHK